MSTIQLHNHTFHLLSSKAVLWDDKKTLMLSDLHLGKAAHFRKHGLALPYASGLADLQVLEQLLLEHKPERLLILGDLFHSSYNADWEHFGNLRNRFPQINFELVPGNHDILHTRHYHKYHIHYHNHTVIEDTFVFSHKPLQPQDGFINFSGHIHPGIHISGKGKQSVKLPCFYLRNGTFLLPAFGKLTGLCLMPREADAQIYVAAGKTVQKF